MTKETPNYTVSELGTNERKVAVSVTAKDFAAAYQKGFEKVTKDVQVHGFRKGKAPKAIVEKMYGQSIKWETFQDLVDSSWRQVLQKESLEVFGDPKFDFKETQDFDKGFSYEVTCTLWPRPKVKKFEGIEAEVKRQAVAEAEVDKLINSFREAKGSLKKIEGRDVAKKEDIANISVRVAKEDGTFSESPEVLPLQLGRGEFLKDLESGIEGMKIGDVKIIEMVPTLNSAGEAQADGAGKKIRYEVTLLGLDERVLAELNEDFIKALGFGVATSDELKAKIRGLLEDERKKKSLNDAQVAIIDKLVEANPFELPQAFIDEEVKGLLIRSGTLSEADAPKADVSAHRAQFGPIAEKRVRGILLVDAVADELKINATPEEITQLIQEEAAARNMSVEQAVKARSKYGGGITSLMVESRRTKTLQHLVDKAKINYVDA